MQFGTYDGGLIAAINAVFYFYLVHDGDIVVGRGELEAIAVGDASLQEFLHHVIPHEGLLARGREIASEANMRLQVGCGIDELIDIRLCGLQKYKATEDAMYIGSHVGSVVEATAKELIRIEGTNEGFVVAEALGID